MISRKISASTVQSRNVSIDFARTLAISMVILVHTMGIGFGRFGVQLFFVISGYLLGKFYETQSKSQFIIHRAFRLFPLAFFFILFFYLDRFGSIKNLILNLSLMQNLWWNWDSFPGGWSISSEWIFSLALLLITPVRKKFIFFLLISSCLLQFLTGFYLYTQGGVSDFDSPFQIMFKTWLNTTNPYINLGFFIAGIIIRHNEIKILKIKNFKLILVFLVMIIEDFLVGHFVLGWQFAIPALFIICLKSHFRGGVALLCTFIGKRTYGTFFIHFLILENLDYFFSSNTVDFLVGNPMGKFMQFIFVYLLAVMGGSFTYRFIEKPSLNFSRLILSLKS